MDFKRRNNETFLEYADRLLTNKKDYDLDNSEVYELFFNLQASSDHARKALTTAQMIVNECKKDNITDDVADDLTNQKCTIELNKDGSQSSSRLIEMSNEQAKDVDFLLVSHGYCAKTWQLVSARNNIWNSYSKVDGIMTLYSSKITVKPATEYIWNAEDIQIMFNNLKTDYKNKINIIPERYEQNGDTLIVPIADFHFGLLSDIYSTGNAYNLDIAEEVYYYTLNDIINRTKHRRFEKVVFIIGNDFVNSDNVNGTTTKGTPQDNAASWFDIIPRTKQLIVNGIDMLTAIAPVDVVYVPSNHDLHTMFGMMQTIDAWYRKDENVVIDGSPLPRKYYKIGETLLCLSHDMKVKDALRIVTSEAKDQWSGSEHIICLLAHLHQAMEYEKQGYLEIKRLPTISGWSRWSNDKGYIQSEKKNQAFIINTKLGITDVINTVIK